MFAAVGDNASLEKFNYDHYLEDETDKTAAMETVNVKHRLGATLMCERRWSPELNDGNKRPAIMCNFFAKGWCIKGKSCRFLHARDEVGSQLKEGVAGVAKLKTDNPLGEVTEYLALESGEIPTWKSDIEGSQKGDPGSTDSCKYIGRKTLERRSYLDGHGDSASPTVKCTPPAYSNSALCGVFSGSPLKSSDSNRNSESSYIATSAGETTNRIQVHCGDENFPISSHGEKISPFLFGSSCRNTDINRPQKCLDSAQEYHCPETSYLQCNSLPFLGSESGSQNQIKQPAEFKTILYGNWESSVPFRPSYLITKQLLSAGKPYDPIYDSNEETHFGDKLSQFSSCDQGSSVENGQLQIKAYTKAAGNLCPEYKSASNFNNNVIQKHPSITESSTADTSAKQQKSCLLNAEELSLSTQSRGNIGADDVDIGNDSGLHKDIQNYTSELQVGRARRDNEADVHLQLGPYVLKESKELKIFHTALVEHVKGLIRQPWHEGRLSKDAYKLIVKRAADKVLSTFEPHQIPITSESIDQYLKLSQTKLVNLVEGYVDKYGKCLPG